LTISSTETYLTKLLMKQTRGRKGYRILSRWKTFRTKECSLEKNLEMSFRKGSTWP